MAIKLNPDISIQNARSRLQVDQLKKLVEFFEADMSESLFNKLQVLFQTYNFAINRLRSAVVNGQARESIEAGHIMMIKNHEVEKIYKDPEVLELLEQLESLD
jgi:hypothetical protein